MKQLTVEGLTKRYGGVLALDHVSFDLEKGENVGLIGPNGSGKTTLLDTLCGLLHKDEGRVWLDGKEITSLKPHQIAGKGIGRTFQISKVFEHMTVLENLLCVPVPGIGPKEKMKRVNDILGLIRLGLVSNEYAGNLSGGQKKLLELGRILIFDPILVMLDEPFSGVDSSVLKDILELLKKLNGMGTTFLIVEHNIAIITQECSRVIVLDEGQKIADGQPDAIRNDHRVIEAYLGA